MDYAALKHLALRQHRMLDNSTKSSQSGRCLFVFLGFIAIIGLLIVFSRFDKTSSAPSDSVSAGAEQRTQTIVLPFEESEFIQVVSGARNTAIKAENDMQRGGFKAARDVSICRVLKSENVSNWVGTVRSVDSNSDGKGVLSIAIADYTGMRRRTPGRDRAEFS
jgi:hypothetical protein